MVKKTTEKQDKKASKRPAVKGKGLSLWILTAPFAIPAIVVALVLYFVAVGPLIHQPAERVTQAYNQHQGKVLSGATKAVIQAKQKQLEALMLDAELVTLTSADDFDAAQQRLRQMYPNNTGLRVVAAETNRTDRVNKPAINNIILDNFQRLKDGEQVYLELMRDDGEVELFFTGAIKANQQIVGFAVIAMEKTILSSVLAGADPQGGFWELVQEYGNSRMVAAAGGNTSLISAPETKFDVGVGRWVLSFKSPIDSLTNAGSNSGTLFIYLVIVGALGTLCTLGAGYLVTVRIEKDARSVTRIIVDNFGRTFRIGQLPVSLAIFNEMIELVAMRSKEVTAQAVAASPVAAKSEAVVTAKPKADALEILDDDDQVPAHIFRAYDIRGVVGKELTPELATQIGMAVGSEAYDKGLQTIVVARDGRNSGPELLEALKDGLKASGRDVIDIGDVPTPVLYFATHHLNTQAGVMVTGSHNPAEYNGFKIVLGGDALSGDGIQKLYQRINEHDFMSGSGMEESKDVRPDYINRITSDVALAQPLKVVIDCGNGIAGGIAPQLLQMLGCEVVGLFCEVDGNFPNHHPDPSKPENLEKLIALVRQENADVGIAYDGDGDRIGVIASDGTVIWPDRQMMLYSMDLLNRHPGADIIYDVKCSRNLANVISANGGRPIMYKTGHSFMKAKMKETGALLAGEQSGHIFFKERWYGFDDALYASARLLEILANDFRKSAEIFGSLPNSINTPEINMAIADNKKFDFMERLAKEGDFKEGNIYDIDGVRVEFEQGWGLVRASNTTPNLVIRFEADSKEAMAQIQQIFRDAMLAVEPELSLPF